MGHALFARASIILLLLVVILIQVGPLDLQDLTNEWAIGEMRRPVTYFPYFPGMLSYMNYGPYHGSPSAYASRLICAISPGDSP